MRGFLRLTEDEDAVEQLQPLAREHPQVDEPLVFDPAQRTRAHRALRHRRKRIRSPTARSMSTCGDACREPGREEGSLARVVGEGERSAVFGGGFAEAAETAEEV